MNQLNPDTDTLEIDKFDELPDAPPRRRLKLSWVGMLSVLVVFFWVVMIIIGPSIAPFHQMDFAGDDGWKVVRT